MRLIRSVIVVGALVATCLAGVSAVADAAPAKRARTARSPRATRAIASVKATQRRAALTTGRRRIALARIREQREAQEPRFKMDDSGAMVPDVRAEAAIVYDPLTGRILYEENSQLPRSIASITKVMTAAVFLEDNPDLSQEVVVQREDVRNASTTHLRAGYRVSTDDLLHLLLIASDNAAARALARVSPFGAVRFIERMNEKARELGLDNTSYADPSGLFSANVSSALDMAKLITYVSNDERIASIMRSPTYTFPVGRRTVSVNSTNRLVRQGDVDVQAGKTGFIRSAGYCLATLLRLPQGNPVAVVVLGARSNSGRFMETRHLFNWLSGKGTDWFGAAAPKTTAAVQQ